MLQDVEELLHPKEEDDINDQSPTQQQQQQEEGKEQQQEDEEEEEEEEEEEASPSRAHDLVSNTAFKVFISGSISAIAIIIIFAVPSFRPDHLFTNYRYVIQTSCLDVVVLDFLRTIIVLALLLLISRGRGAGIAARICTLVLIINGAKCFAFRNYSDHSSAIIIYGITGLNSLLFFIFLLPHSPTLSVFREHVRYHKEHKRHNIFAVLSPYFTGNSDSLFHRVCMILQWVFIACAQAATITAPLQLAHIITLLQHHEKGEVTVSESEIARSVFYYILLRIAPKFLNIASSTIFSKYLRVEGIKKLNATVFHRLHSYSHNYHHHARVGQDIEIVNAGFASIDTILDSSISLLPSIIGMLVAYIVMVKQLEAHLVAAVMFFGTSLFIWMTVSVVNSYRKERDQFSSDTYNLRTLSTETNSLYEAVLLFDPRLRFFDERWKALTENYALSWLKLQTANLSLNAIQAFIQDGFTRFLVLLLPALAIVTASPSSYGVLSMQTFTVSKFVALASYVSAVFGPLETLSKTARALGNSFIDLFDFVNLLNLEEEEDDNPDENEVKLIIDNASGGASVEFRDVCFTYPRRLSNFGLKGVSFVIPKGTAYAIVGEDMSGKATIFRLLTRLYDTSHLDHIFINGQPIKKCSRASVRENITLVRENANVFKSLSLRDNVLLSRPDATREEVDAAIHGAGLGKMLIAARLWSRGKKKPIEPMADNLLPEQTARLSFARCLLRRSPLILLDRVLSGIVSSSHGHDIIQELKNSGSTVIAIERRDIRHVRGFDHILYLKEGRLVESGTHKELMKKKDGNYRASFRKQKRPDRSCHLSDSDDSDDSEKEDEENKGEKSSVAGGGAAAGSGK